MGRGRQEAPLGILLSSDHEHMCFITHPIMQNREVSKVVVTYANAVLAMAPPPQQSGQGGGSGTGQGGGGAGAGGGGGGGSAVYDTRCVLALALMFSVCSFPLLGL